MISITLAINISINLGYKKNNKTKANERGFNCQLMNKLKERTINTIERQVKSLTTHKPYIDCILSFYNKPHTVK